MRDTAFWTLIVAAVGVAISHAALGPDHYLPFVMLSRARAWSVRRTVWITAVFGTAHVLSSILLGTLGLLAGVAVGRLSQWEQVRGTLAAWALVAVGLAYLCWGLRRAVRLRAGIEPHDHRGHVHLHRDASHPESQVSFWSLFLIFVLGPCEPLIPLFVVPASRGNWSWAVWTAVAFGVATVASMVAMTLIGLAGLKPLLTTRLARFSHALAGATIAASGLSILALDL